MDTTKLTAKTLASVFDHTFLKAYATHEDFDKLCREAKEIGAAMVAINASPVTYCKEQLKDSDVHVGAAIAFPLGQTTLETKILETQKAIADGADEIDYVINIGEAKMHHWDYLEREMREITQVCHKHALKEEIERRADDLVPKHITTDDIFASVSYLINLANGVGTTCLLYTSSI